jgi:hypothetical protein
MPLFDQIPMQDLADRVQNAIQDEIRLFLITRDVREGVPRSKKDIYKYRYRTYHLQVDSAIREFVQSRFVDQLRRARNAEVSDYRVIDDDEARVRILDASEKQFSFMEVFRDHILRIDQLHDVRDFNDLQGEVWAYVFSFTSPDGMSVYSLNKLGGGKVAGDARDVNRRSGRFNALFNTRDSRLELVPYPTVSLERIGAAFYYDERFYIINKAQFEQIAGIEEDFAAVALSAVESVAQSELFQGLDLVIARMSQSSRLMKRLANLTAVEGLTEVSAERLERMKVIADRFKLSFRRDADGRVLIENQDDLDAVVELLEDFYVQSEQTGFDYGSRTKRRVRRRG